MSYTLKIINDKDGAIAVLFGAARWLESIRKVHSIWWKSENMNPKFFLEYAEENEFYCGFVNGVAASAMILQDSERNQNWEYIDHEKRRRHYMCIG